MGRREDAAKLRKLKRRGRFARFSGSTSKTVVKMKEVLVHLSEEETRVKTIEVYVGPKSLSKQSINTGRGPDPQRMQQYYDAVPTRDTKEITLAEDLGIKDKRYATIWWDTPKTNKLNLVINRKGRLDLFYSSTGWFFVELNYKDKVIRRSEVYGGKDSAMRMLSLSRIRWVEQIPIE